ncbi:inositol monophosphatase [Candidatus Woesebacteria bacterium]|nr:inositol monophosphatase [Candidatus Woesebacteria bacterium]
MKCCQENILDYSEYIVKKVGKFLKKNFGQRKAIKFSKNRNIKIDEDLMANKMYEDFFKKHTKDFGLYTEEGTRDQNKEYIWAIDPIEGTSNYRAGNPFWATQIALLKNYKPVISFVYAPILNMFFKAIKGSGSFLNDKKIKVSDTNKLDMALVSIGKGIDKNSLEIYKKLFTRVIVNVRTFRHFGACGLELAMTSAGLIDIYLNKGSNSIYDYSPGSLIVKEAGGIVTDFNGNKWNIKSNQIIASNKILNKLIIKVLD